MRPGNILRWYVQLIAIWEYIEWRSRNPSPTGISAWATMFWTSHAPSTNSTPGTHSRSRLAMNREAYTHWYQVLQPVTTSLPLEKRRVVQSGSWRRTVMAANLRWS